MMILKRLIFSCVSLLVSLPLYALEFDAGAGISTTYTNNSKRTERNETDDWIFVPDMNFGASHESRTVSLASNYAVTRRIYQNDSYNKTTTVVGNSTLLWNTVPERLLFSVVHNRTENAVDAAQANTPDNRQETQRLSASLQYSQPIVGRQVLNITARHSDDSYEKSQNGGTLSAVDLGYDIGLSRVRGIEIFGTYSERKYDNFDGFDYDSTVAGLRFRSESPSGSVNLEVGHTWIEREFPFEDSSGYTGMMNFNGGLQGPVQWGLQANRSYQDRNQLPNLDGVDTSFLPGEVPGDDLQNSNLTDVFISTGGSIYISRAFGSSNTIRATLSIGEEDYEVLPQDRKTQRVMVNYTRQLRPRWSLQLNMSYSELDFVDRDEKVDIASAGSTLVWTANPKLNVSLSMFANQRDSTIDTSDYDEISGSIRVSYQFLGAGR